MTPEQSYAAARTLHETRVREGWRPIGRKIGFTNRSIWPRYGVYEPIWGTVYDRTLIESAGDQATVDPHIIGTLAQVHMNGFDGHFASSIAGLRASIAAIT